MTTYSRTATRILDVTQELIQRRGYHAISFNDIALEVGIKKPSVIHHFASKQALGIAVVQRYRESFSAQLNSLLQQNEKSAVEIFDAYCSPYLDFGKSGDKICLCGALAGELMALPKDVNTEVGLFFNENTQWLTTILERGVKDGSYTVEDRLSDVAKYMLSALQGALIVKRATNSDTHLKTTIALLKSRLMNNE